ncbi:MAG: hypothetical protein H0V50_06165 [Thermoleophilaceae bacterium]|jgi:hypothetical protein|nr:hypothetical protein [Thermoleophilaceae bacterium]
MEIENEENQKSDETATAQNTEVAPAVEAVSDEIFPSELNDPRWSVISFEKSEATYLTYDEAALKSRELATDGISGLCIVTNEAAQKVKSKKAKGKISK